MSDALSIFGRRIRARRSAAVMTQVELANATGLSRSSIANIEGGRQNVPITIVEELAAAFGITPPELLATDPAPEEVDRIPELFFSPAELYRQLDDRRMELGLMWRDVAYAARVSASTLTRLGAGNNTDVNGLVRLLAWLGSTDIAPFVAPASSSPDTPKEGN